MGKKFLIGDIVVSDSTVFYMVIYRSEKPQIPIIAGERWDGKYPEGTVPCIRLRNDKSPDRRFMSVRSTKTVIGQFKIWFIKEEELHLLRRIDSEKTKHFFNLKNHIMKHLNKSVFPSDLKTIEVGESTDLDYGGAHKYQFRESLGFNNGSAEYTGTYQAIQFVQKDLDGKVTPGIQSEQLLIALIDRHKKLNEKFPSREGALAITKMEEALMWLEARVKERIEREVMGDLKK